MRGIRYAWLLAAVSLTACHSSTSPSTSTTTTTTTTTTTPTYTLTVSGSPILTGLRQRSQMTAIITNDDGTTQDVTKSSTWLSSNPSVATVTGSGVVTTIAGGSTHLTAVYQTTSQGFDLEIAPVATTFAGVLQSSDGRNGTFSVVVHGATDPTSNTVSAPVSGALEIQGGSVTVSGFYESLTGAIEFSGVDLSYRFSGTVSDGVLAAGFNGPDGETGVIASTSMTVS